MQNMKQRIIDVKDTVERIAAEKEDPEIDLGSETGLEQETAMEDTYTQEC